VVLFEDETDLLVFPPLRAAWAHRGQQAEVMLAGWNAKAVIFGTLNPHTGHRVLLARSRQRAEDFQAFLRYLRQQYRNQHLVLLLDEDPSHTAVASFTTAADLGIDLFWLPKRSPHLNPVDHLWRTAKQHVCANRQYHTLEELIDRFTIYVLSLPPHIALRLAGIQSQDFWLRHALSNLFCLPT